MAHSESFSATDPSKLNGSELDCLKEAFSLFDADHDGEITVGK
jgi:Ca2+-binding EF-hand superfamily protein